jgi:MinD-like ATPase involved in chromosome partitioning or flagellar assembly
MATFDRVLPELIRICHDDLTARRAILRLCIVRDVRGRVRLVVDPELASFSLTTIEASLAAALGDYFVGPILSTKGGGELQGLAKKLMDRAKGQWPRGWPTSSRNLLGGGDTPIGAGDRWLGIERTIGKEAWLTTTPRKPWPLTARTPPIITFHSFKGGVGRTTLVAAYAIQLASRTPPRRVAIVDLDLEAPGVGSLFGVNSERGVLDVLVDHIATGQIDLEGAATQAQLGSAVDRHLTIFSAGSMGDSYVQKLARLDFSSTEPGQDNPVGVALAAMLKQMKSSYDVILLDSRAGLHDLAGMSLHGLAHIDVLVFRGTAQNLSGLGQALRTIGDRDEEPALVLIETLLPTKDDELELRRRRTREAVYALLCKFVYPDDDPPQLHDVGVPHDVISVRRRDWLDGIDSFKDHVQAVLNESELGDVARRIDEACAQDDESES